MFHWLKDRLQKINNKTQIPSPALAAEFERLNNICAARVPLSEVAKHLPITEETVKELDDLIHNNAQPSSLAALAKYLAARKHRGLPIHREKGTGVAAEYFAQLTEDQQVELVSRMWTSAQTGNKCPLTQALAADGWIYPLAVTCRQ